MNELLGWYGYDRLADGATRGSGGGGGGGGEGVRPAPPSSSPPASASPCSAADGHEQQETCDSAPGKTADDVNSEQDGSKCVWCGSGSAQMQLQSEKTGKKVALCGESCFVQMRHSSFKKAKLCDWCHAPRQTLTFVDFQDGDNQLQFCGDQCLNNYKMHIFCRETQEHLQQMQMHGSSAGGGGGAGGSNGGEATSAIAVTPSSASSLASAAAAAAALQPPSADSEDSILITPDLWNSGAGAGNNKDHNGSTASSSKNICRHRPDKFKKKLPLSHSHHPHPHTHPHGSAADCDVDDEEDKPLDLKVKPRLMTSLTNTCKLAVKRKMTTANASQHQDAAAGFRHVGGDSANSNKHSEAVALAVAAGLRQQQSPDLSRARMELMRSVGLLQAAGIMPPLEKTSTTPTPYQHQGSAGGGGHHDSSSNSSRRDKNSTSSSLTLDGSLMSLTSGSSASERRHHREREFLTPRDELHSATGSPLTGQSGHSQLLSWSPLLSIPFMAAHNKLSMATVGASHTGSGFVPHSAEPTHKSPRYNHSAAAGGGGGGGNAAYRSSKTGVVVASQLSCPPPKTLSTDEQTAVAAQKTFPFRCHSQPATHVERSPYIHGISPTPEEPPKRARRVSPPRLTMPPLGAAMQGRSHSHSSLSTGTTSSSSSQSGPGLLPPCTLLVPYPFPVPLPVPIPIPIFIQPDGKIDMYKYEKLQQMHQQQQQTTIVPGTASTAAGAGPGGEGVMPAAVTSRHVESFESSDSPPPAKDESHAHAAMTNSRDATPEDDHCSPRIVCACCNRSSTSPPPAICVKQEHANLADMDDDRRSNGRGSASPPSADAVDVEGSGGGRLGGGGEGGGLSLLSQAGHVLASLTNPRYIARRNRILDAPSQSADEGLQHQQHQQQQQLQCRSAPVTTKSPASFESYQLWLRDMHQRGQRLTKSKAHLKY